MTMDTMKHEERKHKSKYTRAHADTTDHKDSENKQNLQMSQVDDKNKNDVTKDKSTKWRIRKSHNDAHWSKQKRRHMKWKNVNKYTQAFHMTDMSAY
jgi:hypothetical protein